MSTFDLQRKAILVTGGYGYLGAALSRGLADAGATVYVLGRSKDKFAAAMPRKAPNIHFVECDISDTNSIRSAVGKTMSMQETLDVLINNAMYSRGNEHPLRISDEDWRYSVDGVLDSAYRCIREVAPIFKSQESGAIVNVSSMYGMVPPDFSIYEHAPEYLNPPQYGAAKAALLHLTRYFARYLGAWNVRVNSLTPGPFPNLSTQENTAFIEALEQRTMLGRIGRPEDLVGAAIYLCSSASAYVTGQNLVVDGGWTAR